MAASSERRLSKHGQDRKAAILCRAEALFAEHGFDDVRVADIMRAARLAKGLFYWYFESKEALLRELILDLRRRLQEVQAEAISSHHDPLAKIYVGSKASVEFVAEHFPIYGLFPRVAADPRFAPVLAESTRRHTADTAAVLREGQQLGVIRTNDNPVNLAHANAGVVTHFALLLHLRQVKGSTSDIASAAARYIVRGVAADETLAAAIEARFAVRPVANRHRAPSTWPSDARSKGSGRVKR